MNAWYRDPLLLKECRTRLRARTVLTVELLYVCALCGVTFLTLIFGGRSRPSWEAGAALFSMLAYTQAMILLFVTPLVSASAVSGEKEQKTFDSLMVTPVSPRRVVLTKLAAVLAVFVVLLAVSVPFAAVAYILGGVSLRALAVAWGYTLLLTVAMGALGLYWSTRFDRSIASIPAAAVCAVLVGVVMPVFCDSGPDILKSFSPTLFLGNLFGDGRVRWFGADLPFWPFVYVLLVCAFGGLVSATVQRLRFVEERQYLVMRAFGLSVWIIFVAGLLGEVVKDRPDSPEQACALLGQAMSTLCILLVVLALWIGASIPVIRSGRTAAGAWPGAAGAIATALLTQPVGFVALLAGSGCLVLGAAWICVGSIRQPAGIPLLNGVGLVLAALTWTLCSFRLSDRKTTRGRFIGFALACLLAAAVTLVPSLLMGKFAGQPGGGQTILQLAGLLSPLSTANLMGMPHAVVRTSLSGVIRLTGEAGLWAVMPAFYALVMGVLALPVYPSDEKRRRKAASAMAR